MQQPHPSTKLYVAGSSDTLLSVSHLDPVVGLLVDDGDVGPVEFLHDLHHGLHLVLV